MDKYGKDVNSMEAWDQMAKGYSDRLTDEYHNHRLVVINSLIPEDLYRKDRAILDFGCGDAVLFEQFLREGCYISGIDISSEMISLAKRHLLWINRDPDLANVGSVSDLSNMGDNSLDAILCFNVLAYLMDDEEDLFYKEAYRLLRPGAYLIVTHSNELFDMYSLNQFTTEFFGKYLVTDDVLRPSLQTLIEKSSKANNSPTYNIRENPLTYRFKLRKYGFSEIRQEFINLHVAPPPLLPEYKSYPDTLSWNEEDKWKLMFICSTFGSVSVR